MKNAYITLYLTLILGVLLSLAFVLLEGVRERTIRTEVEGVMDIALFSVFGEFNRQLLEQYDLFLVDTSYGEGKPDIKRMEEHLQYYMNENFHKKDVSGWMQVRDFTGLNCDNVEMEAFVYAMDQQGQLLKKQIVEYMQDVTGVGMMENLLNRFIVLNSQDSMSIDLDSQWDAAEETLNVLVKEKEETMINPDTGEKIPIEFDNPANYVKGIKAQGILGLAIPPEKELSSMMIHPEYYFSHRRHLQGQGSPDITQNFQKKATDKYLFIEYLSRKCGSYSSLKENALLKYQVEYLLCGKAKDLDNLEEVMTDILHIREGINFTYLMSDGNKLAQAEAYAWMISALFLSPEIKDAVKATLLFAWSYAESVKDVRILMDGGKLPLLKSQETWNTPLSQLLMFTSCLDQYKVLSDGMTYDDYLKFFLSIKSEQDLLYRFADICEMDIRMTQGNDYFQMDGCVGAIRAKANISSGYGNGYEIIRAYAYE